MHLLRGPLSWWPHHVPLFVNTLLWATQSALLNVHLLHSKEAGFTFFAVVYTPHLEQTRCLLTHINWTLATDKRQVLALCQVLAALSTWRILAYSTQQGRILDGTCPLVNL